MTSTIKGNYEISTACGYEYDKGKLWYQKYKPLKTYGPC